MMKSIGLMAHKPDLTRAAFQDYYEQNHAPLAIKHFPFAKYVRNHIVPDAETDIGFDTISEFWCDDLEKLRGLMTGAVGEIMRADERRFMDQSQIRSGATEEFLVRGTPRPIDVGTHKEALLLKHGPSLDRAGFDAALKSWSAGLAADRVTLDLISPWPGPAWPFAAIVWLWQDQGAAVELGRLPPGISLWRRVPVVGRETSPDRR